MVEEVPHWRGLHHDISYLMAPIIATTQKKVKEFLASRPN
jgi:hypothetical protein